MFGIRTKPRCVVLGAGPAGLLAAHAAERRGLEVTVYTEPDISGQPKSSELHGCQYLHSYIPGIEGLRTKGQQVQYLLDGTVEGYRRKVYGDGWDGQVSPDEYGPEASHYAWNLRHAYDQLWENWKDRIEPRHVSPQSAAALADIKGLLVLCTIPARSLCLNPEEHRFATQQVWAKGGIGPNWRPNGGENVPASLRALPYYAPEHTVQCNGNEAPHWYRAATVFGHSTLEWPAGARPPISGVVKVEKPLRTNCDCHMTNGHWHRLGRYGQWSKSVLVHEAYFEALVLR